MTLTVKRAAVITYEKATNEVLPFNFDWRAAIDAHPALRGVAITASAWTVITGAGLTFGTPTFTADGTTAYATSGTIGVVYRCKNAVTVGTAVLEHFFKISIVDPGA